MTISTHDFNKARDMLIKAGSKTASLTHPKHGGDAWPDGHGVSMLREARDEFNRLGEPARSDKRAIVVSAAAEMNIANW